MCSSSLAPLVSVITPTFNSSGFIGETIGSVRNQVFESFEHIIIDDASTDNTVEIVRRAMIEDQRIKLIQLEENSGAAAARNAGITGASGRYIAFLDADDLWEPDKLSVQIGYMQLENVPFTFSNYGLIDVNGEPIGNVRVPGRVTYNQLLRNNVIGCLTAVFDTSYFGKENMPLVRKRQDLGLWLSLLKRVPVAIGLDESLGKYRIQKGSISHRKSSAAVSTWRLYRDVEKLPLVVAIYYFTCYAFNGVMKTYLRRKCSPGRKQR